MHRARWASEVIDLIGFDLYREGLDDIMPATFNITRLVSCSC